MVRIYVQLSVLEGDNLQFCLFYLCSLGRSVLFCVIIQLYPDYFHFRVRLLKFIVGWKSIFCFSGMRQVGRLHSRFCIARA